jgi:hypothetical protein
MLLSNGFFGPKSNDPVKLCHITYQLIFQRPILGSRTNKISISHNDSSHKY